MASELKVNKITPESGVTLTLGDSGDTINFGSGVLPNFENLTVTGDLTVDTNSLKVDSTNNFVGIGTATPAVALDVVGAITATGNITGTLATAAQPNITSLGTLTGLTTTGNIDLGDSDKVRFGATQRFQMYHDGTNSFIENLTGQLTIANYNDDKDIILKTDDGSGGVANYVFCDGSTGEVLLFHSGSQKLATTSTGIDVTGTVVSDELTVDTDTLYVDSSNNRVGIGTSNPSQKLTVRGGRSVFQANSDLFSIQVEGASGVGQYYIGATNEAFPSLVFSNVSGLERMRIDDSGNVGIGTSSPSRTLHINSTGTSTGGAYIYSNAIHTGTDTQSLLSVRSDNASSTGTVVDIRGDGTGDILNVKDTTLTALIVKDGGNVGIGTSSPSSLLHIYSTDPTLIIQDGGAYGTNATPTLSLRDGSGAMGSINYSSAGLMRINQVKNNDLTFATNNTERMRIDSSGNVQIGSTNTGTGGSKEVSIGSTSLSGGITLWSPTTAEHGINFGDGYTGTDRYRGTIAYKHADDAMFFSTASSERMRIDNSGNVGIGTTSPSAKLHVAGGNPVAVIESTTSSGSFMHFENTNSSNINRLGYAVHDFVVDTNGSEAMRIDSSGNVLLGKTSSGAGNRGVEFTNLSSANPRQTITSTGTGAETKIEFRNGNGYVGEIFTNGSGTTYLTSSDYRLKENVVDLDDATTRVKQLQPKRFNFIADADITVDGFLAHEVSDIVPEAIKGTKDEVDAEGNPVYQGIDQSKLVPLLVASLKEALTEIDNLKARVDTLEGN